MSSNPEREANDAQDIEYGLQDARRRVSYEHRGSSSLSPRQFMECEGTSRRNIALYVLFYKYIESLSKQKCDKRLVIVAAVTLLVGVNCAGFNRSKFITKTCTASIPKLDIHIIPR